MNRHSNIRLRLLLGSALLAVSMPTLAQAQAQTQTHNQTIIAPEMTPAGPATGLEDVVVTATKRETSLQRTPIAITVVNSEALENRQVKSLMDLADGAVPGLRIATFEARQSALTIGIRGIVPLDANQPAREQGVGVYIDGVYLGRQHGLAAALLDVERIEVLRGPQGTLFGRNTEGGALSIVTREPTGVFGMRTTAGISNYSGYNSDIHVDFPRVGDFSFKVDAALQHQDATTSNPLPGQTGFNFFDRHGLHAVVRWQPTDRFTADLSGDVSRDENSPFYSQLLSYNPNSRPIGPATGPLPSGQIRPLPPIVQVRTDRMDAADIGVPQQPSVDITRGLALNLKYKVNDNLELRSITAYREVDVEQWDNVGGAHRVPAFVADSNFSRYSLAGLWQHQFSQEFQAVGNTDRFDYVAGLYYYRENASDDAATPSTNHWNATGTAYTINDPTPTIRGFRSLDRASRAESTSYAAYGQFTWTPAILDDTLHIIAGGRYTHDDKSGELYIVNNVATNLTFDQRSSRFNPTVTLAWEAAEGINLYAKYATGYRAGGASSRSLTYRAFGPEDVKSYEIGAKTDFLDHRLRVNAAAYMMDRTGSQIDFSLVTPVGASTRNTLETINAPGTTKIKGVELEATAQLTDALTLSGSYAYTDTEVPPTANPFTSIIQPVFIVFTPKNAYSVAVDYGVPVMNGTFKVHLDANYADATQTFDSTPVTNDSSFIVNGRLTLADMPLNDSDARLSVALWSRNLLNEEHVYRRDPANRATLGDYGNFNAPRTFGLEATVRY
jgi:iron complex outermembrane receptor protein